MATLTLLAPLDGWCAPLDEVPDPVFAQCMLGDGLAIDPVSSTVVAPCDGEVTTLPAGGHAVSIRTEQGIDILVHVGIDTVQLSGQGFQSLVRLGQRVRAGEPLIRFDLDSVARAAKSLMTPVVVTQAEGLEILHRHAPGPIRIGDVLLEIKYRAASVPATVPAGGAEEAKRTLSVQLRHGLHARPAAVVARRARSVISKVTIAAHGKSTDARSVTGIMALGVRHGDDVTIIASGGNAAAALDEVIAGVDEALELEQASGGDRGSSTVPQAPARDVSPPVAGLFTGVVAVPGFAVGRAFRLERTQLVPVETGKGVAHESAELERALAAVRARLTRVGGAGDAARRGIVDAHLAFLDDPQLNEAAQQHIGAGQGAGFAWRSAIRQSIAELESLGDARMRERADDLLDIESHVLLALAGEARPMNLSLPEQSVVIAAELLPSELVALDREHLAAICLSGGGPTSHVAILAAAMDVPMLVGIGASLSHVPNGERAIVDASRGTLQLAPPDAAFTEAEARVRTMRSQRVADHTAAQRECRTRDGTRIEAFANLGSVEEAKAAVAAGAEGCGLLRTEFLFIDRESAPGEAEQLAVYQSIAAALGGRPLVLRLMDVGGDKPLPYLPLPHEDNPALGLRGIRTALRYPELLRTQLRAALRVTPNGVVRLLLPMITDVAEVRVVRELLNELRAQLGGLAPLQLGAMIETPAAALTAERIAPEVDFLSIGSNDLTQYSLAMDRGHPELARRIDALHPAVLKLIALAADAGTRAGKMVAVCGGVAADPAAVPILIGLGVRELSVVPAAIPALKRQVRELDVSTCAELASRCLELESAAEVRALVASRTSASSGGA